MLFFVDDLRPELGCYGQHDIKSPNIDALALGGVLFERAYCQQAICAPSRASMMAGQYPDTLGIYDLWSPLRRTVPGVMSMPRYFHERGYETSSFGKVYHHHSDDREYWSKLPDVPGVIYANPQTLRSITRRHREARAKGLTKLALSSATKGPPCEAADVEDDAYRDGAVAQQAIDALRSCDSPFFMCVGFAKPHLPFSAPQHYWDLYRREDFHTPDRDVPKASPDIAFTNWGELRSYEGMPEEGPLSDAQTCELMHGYAACVSYADAQVGRVLAELDRLGLRDGTIVVLWGDHGYKLGEYGLWCKHTNLELDAHVPLIVSAPGYAKGERAQGLVEMIDVFPTLAALTNGSAPASCEGRSLEPMLKDPRTTIRPYARSQYPRGSTMGYSLRTDRWRYTEWVASPSKSIVARELYDHRDSQTPGRNLADEPGRQELVSTLSKHLDSRSRIAPRASRTGQ
ncbi:sulfatase [Pirellulimonas nuda]|uniref:sulfatase n=1 Tax=Pirellulimonas nuda TaxID=2528009 RepID=UPI001E5F35D8|nr:sulfatase [Pirellulimonas nuda]